MKRLLAMLLALALTLSIVPATALPAFAEETVIEETIPEVTEPLEMEPEVTEPEVTEPEVTEPEVTEPEETEPDQGIAPIDETATEPVDLSEYYTLEEAVYAVQEQLLNRVAAFSIQTYVEYSDTYTEEDLLILGDELLYTASFLYTSPDSGEYLANHCLDYLCEPVYSTDGTYYYFTLSYQVVYLTTAEQEAAVDKKVASILKSLALDDASDYKKAAGIYDYLTKNVTYNNDISTDADLLKFSAYGALVSKTANSYGIASAFFRLAGELGLYVGMMYGEVGSEGYCAWNTVFIDSYYYYADAAQDVGGKRDHFLKGTSTLTGHSPESAYVEAYGEYLSPVDYGTAFIASGTVGDSVNWVLTEDGTLTIFGNGAIPDYTNTTYPIWYEEYRTKVTKLVIKESVTSIGAYAFYGMNKIKNVELQGNSITTIGSNAFYQCNTLTSVTISDGVTTIGDSAFNGCTSLTSVNIPDSVTTIGDSAFRATHLTSVTIPDGVTSINNSAFNLCSRLTSVTIPDSVTTIGDSAFRGCSGLTSVTIPDSVTSIGASAFEGCTALTTVTIPGSVATIGGSAFRRCYGLTSVTILDGVATTIGKYAFYDCYRLTSVTIMDSVTSIGTYAFAECIRLTSVTIPGSVVTIGDSAFNGCTGLNSVTILDGVDTIGKSTFRSCTSLTSVNIPNSVTTIGDSAFNDCLSLKSVTIPGSVTTIGNFAFQNCTGLRSVTISNGVATIGEWAFSNCSALKELALGNSITTIGQSAFTRCTSLTSITIPDSVTSIGSNAFTSCTSLTAVYITDLDAWLNISFESASSNPLYSASNGKLYLNGKLITDLMLPEGMSRFRTPSPALVILLSLAAPG